MESETCVNGQIDAEGPIRSEFFGAARLMQYAEGLAKEHSVTLQEGKPLMPLALENGHLLLQYYRTTAGAARDAQSMTPAAEWLLDNFYVVEEQLREIRDDLSVGFYRTLPKLASGHLQGYPRVLGVAWAYFAHSDSRFEPKVLRDFISAYQRVQPLTIGELWALAICLRVVLLENLRRIAENVVNSQKSRERADGVADTLLDPSVKIDASVATVLNHLEENLDPAFVVRLIQRLHDDGPRVTPILTWLDRRLAMQGTTTDEIVRTENRRQAALNVSARNAITSMRLASTHDWQSFFERVSLVDQLLRQNTRFAEMDFATRDHYRHAIEEMARNSTHSELEVAKRAVERSQHALSSLQSGAKQFGERQTDPGYYLIANGRVEFEHELGVKMDWVTLLLRWYTRGAVPVYLGTIVLVTALILTLPLVRSHFLGMSNPWLIVIAFLATIPASELAIALVNRGVTDLFGPGLLPRMELRGGIPPELGTVVVIPTMLTSVEVIREQVHQLEVHFLASPEGNLRFALLTDWVDSKTECLSDDNTLLATAVEGIVDLNRRYGPASNDGSRFFLFHRKRVWSEGQQRWMGWERKRGKLHELNRLLRKAKDTTFLPLDGNWGPPPDDIRFVITMDADTRLPRGSVTNLVGTMAHPLNRPSCSSSEAIVVGGYSIVQPRITPILPIENEGSLYQKIFAGARGTDPYSHAISDVYQDLFGEGSYTGKGVYDIDAMESALAGKIPPNTILSHDLFEGIFARAALASDIELFEEFPSHFLVGAARQHRWARGDWQLLPWILGCLSRGLRTSRVRIPAIGRWKMIDNLRRSLFAPAAFLVLVVGWLSPAAWVWTRFVLGVIAIPALLPVLMEIYPEQTGIAKRTHYRAAANTLWLGISQISLTLTFLTFNAWLMLDAITRTLWRLLVTHRNMLDWTTAAQAKHAATLNLGEVYLRMKGGLFLAAAAALLLITVSYRAAIVGAPFLLLWMVAPALAHWVSLPVKKAGKQSLSSSDTIALRLIARRTWHFFETFVTPADHSLPPDNFQEDPKPITAHRTSPTNIGLSLLSTLAAHDFGWLGLVDMAEGLEATLSTMGHLEKYRGHFYNWYDTQDLRPLDPKYISSVDSGNLAGHLLTVSNGCREMIGKPWSRDQVTAGIRDSLLLLRDSLAAIPDRQRSNAVIRRQLSQRLDVLIEQLELRWTDALDVANHFCEVKTRAQTIADVAQTLATELGQAPAAELRTWAQALMNCIESNFREAEIIIPLLALSAKDFIALDKTIRGNRTTPTERVWEAVEALLRTIPTLENAQNHFNTLLDELQSAKTRLLDDSDADRTALEKIETLRRAVVRSAAAARGLVRRLSTLADTTQEMFYGMDFSFLFDESRKLLSIGFRVTDGKLDPSHYDLLASEARLASFVSIAKGEAPASHWFRLGRPLTPIGRGSLLLSWSGSMFEYLMPALIMRSPEESLLSQTYELVVRRQIEYGRERHVPWGISESAYNVRDAVLTYQYSAFGVPGLGLKRGLSRDLVIAPYATALAATVEPASAAQNFSRIREVGGQGKYGFYDALDFTSSRAPNGKGVSIVRAYLAHHQGMSLVALSNVLNDKPMSARFHAEPIIQATELLLQERTPQDVLVARLPPEEISGTV
jgi:cyclic beta-1,2-glucan synthetase